MKFSCAIFLVIVAVNLTSYSVSSRAVGPSSRPGLIEIHPALTAPLSRQKRWILSWILTHGALMDRILPNPNNFDPAAETIDTNAVENEVDLSGDTRVNYLDGQGRTGSLAAEGDAEVFDWSLLQEDRNRNFDNGANPHYYEFHPRGEEISHRTSESLRVPSHHTLYSSPYGVRERTATGFIRTSGADLKRFDRTPITYDQTMDFHRSDSNTRNIRPRL